MKMLAFLVALVVLLESTVQAACIDVRPAKEETCCADKGAEDTDAWGDGCDSGCNPFQHCGCCKGNDTLGKITMLYTSAVQQPSPNRFISPKDNLPDDVRTHPKQPPKLTEQID